MQKTSSEKRRLLAQYIKENNKLSYLELRKPLLILMIDDENATLTSMINNEMLVPPENVRDPGSQLYWRILYPKLTNLLRRLRRFMEEPIDDHINWFNDTFDANATRVAEIKYSKATFGPRMSGLNQHKKLLDADRIPANESK